MAGMTQSFALMGAFGGSTGDTAGMFFTPLAFWLVAICGKMVICMRAIRQYNKITQGVVHGVMVFMMNMFRLFQFAAKLLFHQITMLIHPFASRGNLDKPIDMDAIAS